MKKETRSKRVNIAVTPSFWARFSRFAKAKNKGSVSYVSRTDLIIAATEQLMMMSADGQPRREAGNVER